MNNVNKVIFIILIIVVIGLGAWLFLSFEEDRADNSRLADANMPEESSLAAGNRAALAEALKTPPGEMPEISAADHRRGAPEAAITLVVYDNYAAPYGQDFYETVKLALAEYPDDLAVIYRPYFERNSEEAMTGALAAECAAREDKFWAMHEALLVMAGTSAITAEAAAAIADELGIGDFSSCLVDPAVRENILIGLAAAENAWISGAPAFFLNKRVYAGAYPYEDFVRSDGTSERGLKNLILDELTKSMDAGNIE